MPDEQLMDGMMGGMMQFCMVASTLLVLVVLITMIVQAALQAKILRELRQWRAERTPPPAPEFTAHR